MTTDPVTTTPRTPRLTPEQVLDIVGAELRAELRLEEHALTAGDHLDLLPGADSVRLMRVIAALERRYDIEFDDEEIRTAETVGDLGTLLIAGLGEAGSGR
ncbi:acyl carrier protein [Streptomyces pathocidini]|uniref:Acyl carrier protein n=1 Tax=Streptomyces pathocidini TaxID=1650571 RepID=A0ABW7UP52_9ACTN|nr:acyl carrier protein [Streptomyces pathocidini]